MFIFVCMSYILHTILYYIMLTHNENIVPRRVYNIIYYNKIIFLNSQFHGRQNKLYGNRSHIGYNNKVIIVHTIYCATAAAPSLILHTRDTRLIGYLNIILFVILCIMSLLLLSICIILFILYILYNTKHLFIVVYVRDTFGHAIQKA